MGIDEDNHASSHSKKNKDRKSMDMEFHDHLGSDTEPLTEDVDGSSSHHPVYDDYDSDDSDDSFCAASDDCEPDHKFLAEILEDEHPERLNLLEMSVPQPNNFSGPNPAPKPEYAPKLEDQPEEPAEEPGEMDVDDDEKEPEKPESVKVAQELENGINVDEEKNPEEEEETDSFPVPTSAPVISRPALRNGGLGVMGKSTKKSFRGVSGTFFSKPFKGLARSIRRPGTK